MRRVAALAVALLLLAACAGKPTHASHPAGNAPTGTSSLDEAAVRTALLTSDVIGGGFEARYSPANAGLNLNDRGPGCLKPLDAITWVSVPVREQQVVISARPDHGYPLVRSSVATYGTEREAKVAVPAYRTALASCTHVDDTLDAIHWVLAVRSDDEHLAGEVDDELNISGTGTIRTRAGAQRITMTSNVAQVGNNVILTTVISADDSVDEKAAAVCRAAVARLRAVVAGRAVPGTRLGFERYDPDAPAGQAA